MRPVVVIVSIVAGLLPGCGGGREPATSETDGALSEESSAETVDLPSGCELLSDAEVAQALATVIAGHEITVRRPLPVALWPSGLMRVTTGCP